MAPARGNGAPRRWIAVVAAGAAALLAAQLVAFFVIQLLSRISVDQPLESLELIEWGWRWGGVLAVAMAAAAGLGAMPLAGPRTSIRVAAAIAVLTALLCVVAMGLAGAAVRLGLWGQGWGLPSRTTYAAQIAGRHALEWIGLPNALLAAWLLWRERLRGSTPPRRSLTTGPLSLDRITRLLTLVIVLAVALNGLPFWARRIGLLDRQAHGRDLSLFCSPPLQPLWLPATCRPHRRPTPSTPSLPRRIATDRLYRYTKLEAGLKALRYAVIVLLLVASAGLTLSRPRSLSLRQAIQKFWPLLPLLVSSVVSLLISLPRDAGLAMLLSGVWSLWIPQAALSGWLTTPARLRILADGAAALVLVQLPFLLLEAARGLPLPFGGPSVSWVPTRLSGLMNQPNTLGGLLAVSVALCVCIGGRRWQRWPLLLVALAIAVLARSATGVVGLTLVAGCLVVAMPRCRRLPRIAFGLLLLLLLLGMPRLLGRPQLLESPTGRVRTLRHWLQHPHSTQHLLIGDGLASPSRGLDQIIKVSTLRPGPSVDGMPTLLLAQGGLLALGAFYGALSWCCWRDPAWRPFWIVLFATSLTLNVTEVFPIGVWLAVAAARAFGQGGDWRSGRQRPGIEPQIRPDAVGAGEAAEGHGIQPLAGEARIAHAIQAPDAGAVEGHRQ
jgi:hypothetical protein